MICSTSWRPPRATFIKVNSDASYDAQTRKGSTDIICRDDKGSIFTAMASKIYTTSPLVAEASGLRKVVLIGRNLYL